MALLVSYIPIIWAEVWLTPRLDDLKGLAWVA
jgi:hypothetical protein